jgi:hypothetical protein
VLLYRVFPHVEGVGPDQPGHALYVYPKQGAGRWDNPTRYLTRYLSVSPEGSVGEAFAQLSTWTLPMLTVPTLPTAQRRIAVYHFDETTYPLLDLDDASVLYERHLRPTDVVIRNRPKTQKVAADIFDEGRWAGIRWWSYHRPQWPAIALWATDNLTVHSVEDIPGSAALNEAAASLAKARRGI